MCGRLADVPGWGGRTCYWAWCKYCFTRLSQRNFWARLGPGLVNFCCIARYILRKRILPILYQGQKCWFLSCSSPHPFPIICNNQFRLDLQAFAGRWLRQPTNEELYASYYLLLDVAEENGARLWLVDARRREHAT